MPLDPNLSFNFSEPQQQAINDSLDAILTTLADPSVPYVNLTPAERKVPSIGPTRLPYVYNALGNILPLFPPLQSPSIPLGRAGTLMDLVSFITELQPKLSEINDRLTDLGINAENLVYKSMSDSYDTAKRQEGRIPGADVLIEAIAPLFEGQGKKGSGPQLPDDNGNAAPTDGEDDDTLPTS